MTIPKNPSFQETKHTAGTGSLLTPQRQALDPLVQVQEVTKCYSVGSQKVEVLRSVTLAAYQGELLALRGRSGSGKTTLLNLMGGLDGPTTGRIFVKGWDVGAMSEPELVQYRRTTVSFVFQHFALLPQLSALENVLLPLRLTRHSHVEAKTRAITCLRRVGLEARSRHHPTELSGGEQQRVGIARALIIQPALLLADEPTGNLDLNTGRSIMRLLRQVAEEERVAVVVATHDDAILGMAHRVLELHDGRLFDEDASRT